MKKSFFFLLVFSFVFGGLQYGLSQVRFGVKGGVNLASFAYKDYPQEKMRVGFYGGGLLDIPLHKKWQIRPEILYSLKGWRADKSVDLHYLNVPVLIGYKPVEKLSVFLGPEFGLLLASKPSFLADIYRSYDIGIRVGFTYELSPKFGVDATYIYGLQGLQDWSTVSITGSVIEEYNDGYNRVLQIGVYYLFGKR